MKVEESQHDGTSKDLKHNFEEGISRWSRLAYRAAYCILRCTADAEEITQEAVLRAYERLWQIREPERVGAWVQRIAWRLAQNKVRANKTRMRKEALRPRGQFHRETPIDHLIRTERSEHLWNAINALPKDLHAVTVLLGIEEYNIREVATMLRVAEGTVKSRSYRARRMLKHMLHKSSASHHREKLTAKRSQVDDLVTAEFIDSAEWQTE
jgi:RNA polymerase sigma-70 factor (ECF subfamily)